MFSDWAPPLAGGAAGGVPAHPVTQESAGGLRLSLTPCVTLSPLSGNPDCVRRRTC